MRQLIWLMAELSANANFKKEWKISSGSSFSLSESVVRSHSKIFGFQRENAELAEGSKQECI